MRKLVLVAVIVLGGLVVAADLAARQVAEDELRDRLAAEIATEVEVGGPVRASIRSFPFLGRLLVSGTVPEVRASVADVVVEGLRLAEVSVVLHDVELDRDRLVSERQVVIERIGRGTATAEVSQAELTRLVGVEVTLDQGEARARVGGQVVPAEASVSEGVLRVEVAGFDLPAVTLPDLPLLPCQPDAGIVPGRLRLTCALDEVPAELVARAV